MGTATDAGAEPVRPTEAGSPEPVFTAGERRLPQPGRLTSLAHSPNTPSPTPPRTMPTAEQTLMKVQRILTGPMGLKVMLKGDLIGISFADTSTYVHMTVRQWGQDSDGEPRTLVLVTCPILLDVQPTPEVFEWVAREGGSRWFGHVEVQESSQEGLVNLIFSHTLLGDYLDQPELETVMWGLLTAADKWDDELLPRFGGRKGSGE